LSNLLNFAKQIIDLKCNCDQVATVEKVEYDGLVILGSVDRESVGRSCHQTQG